MKILIIEDDRSLIEVLRIYLGETLKNECDSADTIDLSTFLFQKYKYDLILLDLHMGSETTELLISEIRKSQTTPICLISASHQAQKVADEHGIKCICKPFDLDCIDNLLDSMENKKIR